MKLCLGMVRGFSLFTYSVTRPGQWLVTAAPACWHTVQNLYQTRVDRQQQKVLCLLISALFFATVAVWCYFMFCLLHFCTCLDSFKLVLKILLQDKPQDLFSVGLSHQLAAVKRASVYTCMITHGKLNPDLCVCVCVSDDYTFAKGGSVIKGRAGHGDGGAEKWPAHCRGDPEVCHNLILLIQAAYHCDADVKLRVRTLVQYVCVRLIWIVDCISNV